MSDIKGGWWDRRTMSGLRGLVKELETELDTHRDGSSCLNMFIADMVKRELIPKGTAPMMLTEAVCAFIGNLEKECADMTQKFEELNAKQPEYKLNED